MNNIRERVNKIRAMREVLLQELEMIQQDCPHKNQTVRYINDYDYPYYVCDDCDTVIKLTKD